MRSSPLVSIIVPSFNQGVYLQESIKSVLGQGCEAIECIVIDGGSTDCTKDVIGSFADSRLKFISERDKGQTDALRKGFAIASGDLIGWINSDDLLAPSAVDRVLEEASIHKDVAIFFSKGLDFIGPKGEHLGRRYLKAQITRQSLLHSSYDIFQPGSFYRADALRKCELDLSLKYCMDLDLWLQLLDNGSAKAVEHSDTDPLASFRIWGESKTSSQAFAFNMEIDQLLQRRGVSILSVTRSTVRWRQAKVWVKSTARKWKLSI